MEEACGKRTRYGADDDDGQPDAWVAHDVAHLKHTCADALREKAVPAVLPETENGKAYHLCTASRKGCTACQTGERQCGADSRRTDGEGQRDADDNGDYGAHDERLLLSSPYYEAADTACDSPYARRDEVGETYADSDGDKGSDDDVYLCAVGDKLSEPYRDESDDEDGKRTACTAHAVRCPADGCHGEDDERG